MAIEASHRNMSSIEFMPSSFLEPISRIENSSYYSRCDDYGSGCYISRGLSRYPPLQCRSLSIKQWTIFKRNEFKVHVRWRVSSWWRYVSSPYFFIFVLVNIPCHPPASSFIVKSELPHPHVSLCWRNRECCFSFFLIVHTLPRSNCSLNNFFFSLFRFSLSSLELFSFSQ